MRACRGLALTLKTLGPFYRIVIRDAPGGEPGAVLAVSSGFTVPAMGLMHCDSLEIFTRGCAPPCTFHPLHGPCANFKMHGPASAALLFLA